MEKKIEPIYPNSQFKSFCYIKSVVTNPNIIVGDYSYYDDNEDGPDLLKNMLPIIMILLVTNSLLENSVA